MQKITFTENLAHNIALMQSVFEGDDTFIVREATGRNGLHCAMFFFDGMVDSFTINESLVRPSPAVRQAPRLGGRACRTHSAGG